MIVAKVWTAFKSRTNEAEWVSFSAPVACFQEVDVGLVNTYFLAERDEVMDFADVMFFSEVVMVYRKPEAPHDLWMVVRPLSLSLLSALAGSLAAVTLLLLAVEVVHLVCLQQPPAPGRVRAARLIATFDNAIHVAGAAILSKREFYFSQCLHGFLLPISKGRVFSLEESQRLT